MCSCRTVRVIFFLIFGLTGNAVAAQSQLLTLPSGDPEAGRKSFKDLKCNVCHRISSDIEMPAPVVKTDAPDLGARLSRYRSGYYLADSIIFPSHAVLMPDGRFDHFAKLSPMGDFSDAITVRQIADIVAYLRQLDEEV